MRNPSRSPNRPAELFAAFLRLGLTSFGGPIAHLGYFREEFVARRRWLTDEAYADLVALCQFLPGPASSQTSFAIGYLRAGWAGALAAWIAFTAPSAVLMIGCAYGLTRLPSGGWLGGLKVAAAAVVAQAVWHMARTLCPDGPRKAMAAAAAALALTFATGGMQIALITAGLAVGTFALRGETGARPVAASARPRGHALAALLLFVSLLVGLPVLAAATGSHWVQLGAAFYQAGALVFGGGHVVLPLLETATVDRGWVSPDAFLAGYGAAQALPGPLFSFAAYLGTLAGPGTLAGLWCLAAILLPGMLLVVGALPLWEHLRHRPRARRALAGANAVVVGILFAGFCHPVLTGAVTSPAAAAMTLVAFAALEFGRLAPWLLVLLSAGAGAVLLTP